MLFRSGRFPEVGSTAYAMAIERGVARLSAFFASAMQEGCLRRANTHLAAQQFIDLASGTLLKKRVWNVVTSVSAETIAAEAARIAGTFLAAFGNEELSAAARRG